MLIPRHDRRFTGFDDKIVAMYARGMTVREILLRRALFDGHLEPVNIASDVGVQRKEVAVGTHTAGRDALP